MLRPGPSHPDTIRAHQVVLRLSGTAARRKEQTLPESANKGKRP